MKWYCIRPRCLPADQVKDMLVPEKHESAAMMDGMSELPDGMREATIKCLEYIRDVSGRATGHCLLDTIHAALGGVIAAHHSTLVE